MYCMLQISLVNPLMRDNALLTYRCFDYTERLKQDYSVSTQTGTKRSASHDHSITKQLYKFLFTIIWHLAKIITEI